MKNINLIVENIALKKSIEKFNIASKLDYEKISILKLKNDELEKIIFDLKSELKKI